MAEELSIIIRVKNLMKHGFDTAITQVQNFRNGFSSHVTGMLKSGYALAAGLAGVGSAAGLFAMALKKSFEFERYAVQFKVLLGNVDAAKKHIEELKRFGAETPFDLPGISKASKIMLAMSGGILGFKDSLLLVGDAAAAVGQPIEEVGMWVARAYGNIRNGQPFGEAAMRLQEMGLLGGEARKKMEELQGAGASNIDVWRVLTWELEKTKGGMQELSTTGEGLISTLKDTWDSALGRFGDSFQDLAKNKIKALTDKLSELQENGSIDVWANRSIESIAGVARAMAALGKGFNWTGNKIGEGAGAITNFAQYAWNAPSDRYKNAGGGVKGVLDAVNPLKLWGGVLDAADRAGTDVRNARNGTAAEEQAIRDKAQNKAKLKKAGELASEIAAPFADIFNQIKGGASALEKDMATGQDAANRKTLGQHTAALNTLTDGIAEDMGGTFADQVAGVYQEEEAKRAADGGARTPAEVTAAVKKRFQEAKQVADQIKSVEKAERGQAQDRAAEEAARKTALATARIEPARAAAELATERAHESTRERQYRERGERRERHDEKQHKRALSRAHEVLERGGHLTRQQRLLLEEEEAKGRLAAAQRKEREAKVEEDFQRKIREEDQAEDIHQMRLKLDQLLQLK